MLNWRCQLVAREPNLSRFSEKSKDQGMLVFMAYGTSWLEMDGVVCPLGWKKSFLSPSLKFSPLYFCPCTVVLLKIEKFSYNREYFSIYMYYYQKQKINKRYTKKMACLIKDYVSMWNLKISLGVLFYALKMFERPYKTCILHQSLHSFCLSFSTPIKKTPSKQKTKQKKHQAS